MFHKYHLLSHLQVFMRYKNYQNELQYPFNSTDSNLIMNSKQKSTCCDQFLQSCVIVPDRLFFKFVSTLRIVIINITWTYLQCKTRIFMQKRLENTKSVVRSCISKKNRQSNDHEKKDKLHNDIQNTTEKTNDLPCNNLGRV